MITNIIRNQSSANICYQGRYMHILFNLYTWSHQFLFPRKPLTYSSNKVDFGAAGFPLSQLHCYSLDLKNHPNLFSVIHIFTLIFFNHSALLTPWGNSNTMKAKP